MKRLLIAALLTLAPALSSALSTSRPSLDLRPRNNIWTGSNQFQDIEILGTCTGPGCGSPASTATVSNFYFGGFSSTLGAGATFASMVPTSDIILKRLVITVVTPGSGQSGDNVYRCTDGVNFIEATSTGNAVSGSYVEGVGTAPVTAGNPVKILMVSDGGGITPVVDAQCEYSQVIPVLGGGGGGGGGMTQAEIEAANFSKLSADTVNTSAIGYNGSLNIGKNLTDAGFSLVPDSGTYQNAVGIPTGSNPWTVEAWVLDNGQSGSLFSWGMSDSFPGGAGSANVTIVPGSPTLMHYNGITQCDKAFTDNSFTWVSSTWNHVAMVWDGATMTAYINGSAITTGGGSCDPNFFPIPGTPPMFNIGNTIEPGVESVDKMRIDELRFSNSARYSGTFAPADRFTDDANTSLLFHFDGDTTDSSSNGYTVSDWRTTPSFLIGRELSGPSGSGISIDEKGGFDSDGRFNVAGGTVAAIFNGTFILDFPSTTNQQGQTLTRTLNGVLPGDQVLLGIPTSLGISGSSCYSFVSWVSAVNTVAIRFNNCSTTARDPSSGVYNVKVLR